MVSSHIWHFGGVGCKAGLNCWLQHLCVACSPRWLQVVRLLTWCLGHWVWVFQRTGQKLPCLYGCSLGSLTMSPLPYSIGQGSLQSVQIQEKAYWPPTLTFRNVKEFTATVLKVPQDFSVADKSSKFWSGRWLHAYKQNYWIVYLRFVYFV